MNDSATVARRDATPQASSGRGTRRDMLAIGGIGVGWLLMYSTTFTGEFYFADDASYLVPDGEYSWPSVLLYLTTHFVERGLYNGRPVSFFLWGLLGKTASLEGGLMAIRILLFLMHWLSAGIAYALIRRRGMPAGTAAFLVLLVWTQPGWQVVSAWAILTVALVGAWASVASFERLPSAGRNPGAAGLIQRGRDLAPSALLLLVAWATHPAMAFFGVAVAALHSLRGADSKWCDERRRLATYFGLVGVSLLAYATLYRAALALTGVDPQPIAGATLSTLFGAPWSLVARIGSDRSLLPFEFWNYPAAIAPVENGVWLRLSGATGLAWLLLVVAAARREAACRQPAIVAQRYAVALLAAGFTFLPLIVDASDRQHLHIPCTLAIVLIAGHAACVLFAPFPRGAAALAWVGLFVIGFGARGSFDRGLVEPAKRHVRFIAAEAQRQVSAQPVDLTVIPAAQLCDSEPCRGFHARRMAVANRTDIPGYYRSIVERAAGVAVRRVRFASETPEPLPNTIIIDNRRLRRSIAAAGEREESVQPRARAISATASGPD